MKHLVLLGDSIFDNASYVNGGADVVTHLKRSLPDGWKATLLARDGSVTGDVKRQLAQLPADATHLIVSAGGNDALGNAQILQCRARTIAEALAQLADMQTQFDRDYRAMLRAALACEKPAAVCTVYEPVYPDPAHQRVVVTALSLFNDVIIRAATEFGVPVLELRLVCTSPAHFANPIEPSVAGGQRIARAILKLVAEHDFSRRQTMIHGASPGG
jgi:lysophospholipase L1-like esterase